jgi:hypothetical protein
MGASIPRLWRMTEAPSRDRPGHPSKGMTFICNFWKLRHVQREQKRSDVPTPVFTGRSGSVFSCCSKSAHHSWKRHSSVGATGSHQVTIQTLVSMASTQSHGSLLYELTFTSAAHWPGQRGNWGVQRLLPRNTCLYLLLTDSISYTLVSTTRGYRELCINVLWLFRTPVFPRTQPGVS